MDNWKVNDIAKMLVKDEALLHSRRKFARSLYTPGDSLQEFEDEYIRNYDLHSYFCSVLDKWKSINGDKATVLSLCNILRENEFASSKDRLTNFYNGISAPVSVFGLNEPVFNFVGRVKELNELNELFTGRKACVVLSSAMGGKGKTELCRKFIQQLPIDIDSLVTWLSGDGLQQFQQSLTEAGHEMNVSTTDSTGNPISVDKIIMNISKKRKSKWVVVIDNVDEIFEDFNSALNAFLRNGAFVVVTSRKTDFKPDDFKPDEYIFLKDLEDKDARELVKSSLKNTQSRKLVKKLCKSLQNYPLALQQAVAFIKYKQRVKDDSYGIAEYLHELNLDTYKVFNYKIPSTSYDFTIVKIFKLTLSKILSVPENNALSLLNILSLVQPDGIKKEFLKKMFSIFETEELFESSISTLKSVSLIGVNKGEVSVHRIIQKLTIDKIKQENEFGLVIDKLLTNIDIEKLKKKEIVHVIQIWKNALQKSEIIKKNSKVAVKICNRLYELSLYREIKDFSEITLQQFITVLGLDHIDNLKMQDQLGRALEYNGEYEEALLKFQALWQKDKEVLGEEDEETLKCADRTASVLWRLNRFDESLEWFERALKSQVKVHGENHKRTMRTKNNMALLLDQQGKNKEAFSIYKQVLEWYEKEVGHEHSETLITRHNIAACLYNQLKFVESKKVFEEVLDVRVKLQGEDHAETLRTKYWLSRTLHSLGQKEKALEMMEKVLISQEKVIGQNHPRTNNTRDQISEWKNPSMYQAIKNKCSLY